LKQRRTCKTNPVTGGPAALDHSLDRHPIPVVVPNPP
jgi:hypothetical protein